MLKAAIFMAANWIIGLIYGKDKVEEHKGMQFLWTMLLLFWFLAFIVVIVENDTISLRICGIIYILAIPLVIYLLSKKNSPVKSTPIYQKSSTRNSYADVFKKYYEAGIKLLSTLPGFSGDRFELMPFLALIGAASLESEGKELSKYQEEINSYLKTIFHIDREFDLFDERFKFYYEVSTGAPVYGFWSVDNIPPSVLSVPMLRCAVAFGDCITDPERIKDYENAPVLVMGFPDMCTFTKTFTTQFYSFVKTYCTEIVGYDFVPKTLSLN